MHCATFHHKTFSKFQFALCFNERLVPIIVILRLARVFEKLDYSVVHVAVKNRPKRTGDPLLQSNKSFRVAFLLIFELVIHSTFVVVIKLN